MIRIAIPLSLLPCLAALAAAGAGAAQSRARAERPALKAAGDRHRARSCASAIWSRTPAPSPTCRSSARPISARPAACRPRRVRRSGAAASHRRPRHPRAHRSRGDARQPRHHRQGDRERASCARSPANTAWPTPRTSRSYSTTRCARSRSSRRDRRACASRGSAYEPRTGRFDVDASSCPAARSRAALPLRFTGTLIETFEAVVPTRAIAQGEVLKAADLAIERRPKAEFAPARSPTPSRRVGLAAQRRAAGRPGHAPGRPDEARDRRSATRP